ncbi:DNA-3-methyladenine glycosylase family protein [Arthrobacter sp.]|uniref:DNA-3-methyladenine glycosylase family protein n=1 Tax=Arthrobacter sp. TaxID=1667 RepID=UPI003A95D01A
MDATQQDPGPSMGVTAHGRLDPDLCLATLAAHSIPGVDERVGAEHRRPVRLHGRVVPLGLRFTPGQVLVRCLDAPLPVADEPALAALVRRWFGLDEDLEPVNAHLARDPLLARLVARRPALRRIGYPDPFEAAATTVLGQQVSVAAMRTFAGRLVAGWGGDAGPGLRTFPPADVVARIPEDELQAAVGLTRARTRTVLAVARAFVEAGPAADGALPLTRGQLLALPGIGPWSADYLDVRARLDPDAFAAGDLVLRRALGRISAREAEARAEAWRPYRAQALFHLWSQEAYAA